MIYRIPLTKGKWALVDKEDFDRFSCFNWIAQGTGKKVGGFYAARKSNRKLLLLHKEILQAPDGLIVDHENGDTLDCRRDNLRIATFSQNGGNARKHSTHMSSQFKGVSRVSPRVNSKNPWIAYIGASRGVVKREYLGYFKNEVDAARAYDEAAKEKFGPFAHLNFP